ncbi:uncharacterized membrane protein HdeD (DUF308 family) [Shimia isoporae]|uniref:Uncharacterized membrane protein HdeD (DUF308 family) n=1 Tax=Shimia isoporae TaxID=647720 RepID=A0A4R1NLK0_9RHOB|nr:DUF308 domain-containing protein [Shimia isoporae]TCL08589.1 uncharacterized membrane protein HdeD (DUF308 family) [Shimia isoporae]
MFNWIFMLVIGVLSVAAGILALANPFGASVAATVIAGWSFVFLGGIQVVASFSAQGAGAKIFGILFGVIAFIIGLNILQEPLKGMLTLTFVAGIMFLASGITKAWFGFSNAEGTPRMALFLSAFISLALGAMVLSNFPQSAAVILGILLAVELISNGIGAIALALMAKDVDASSDT